MLKRTKGNESTRNKETQKKHKRNKETKKQKETQNGSEKSDVQNDRDRIDRSHARRRSKAAKELAKKVGEQHWQVPLK